MADNALMTNSTEIYQTQSNLPVQPEEAFAYHERSGALQRLLPPWQSIQVSQSDDSLEVGSRVEITARLLGIPIRWVAEHIEYAPPNLFVDRQVSGPFKSWLHRHEFAADGERSILRDTIHYQLPFGPLGGLIRKKIGRDLESMFAFRHRITRDDLSLSKKYSARSLKVAVSGCSGLVGGNLRSMLSLLGHTVRPIIRTDSSDSEGIAAWSSSGRASELQEMDAIVHLAGKPIASGRWTEETKRQIASSRVDKTRQLCETLASLPRKPKVLLCASAVGYYGDRGDELLTEDSEAGDDFLADVAADWERACEPAVDAGIRVVHLRLGIVISARGGALAKMLLPAKFCSGHVGSGKQWVSWIALDDVLGAIYHAIATPELEGAVNLVAPNPVTNKEFARTLGRILGRPALVPAPAFALRLIMGEMADALLLSSTRVNPERLLSTGYEFRFPELPSVLRYTLGRARRPSDD